MLFWGFFLYLKWQEVTVYPSFHVSTEWKTETEFSVTAIIPLVIPALWVSGCFSACDPALQYFFQKGVTASWSRSFGSGAPVNQCLACVGSPDFLSGHGRSARCCLTQCVVTPFGQSEAKVLTQGESAVIVIITASVIFDKAATVFNTVWSQLSEGVFAT